MTTSIFNIFTDAKTHRIQVHCCQQFYKLKQVKLYSWMTYLTRKSPLLISKTFLNEQSMLVAVELYQNLYFDQITQTEK